MTGQPLNGRPRLHIQPTLMLHFEKSPGKLISLEELCRVAGATELQVQKSMGGLRRKPVWRDHLEVIVQGRAWRYNERPGQKTGFSAPHPDASADHHGYAPDESRRDDLPLTVMGREGSGAKRVRAERAEAEMCDAPWREVGKAGNGDIILEHATNLYRATPL